MIQTIHTEEELIKRQSEIETILFRAINHFELTQLLRDGSNSFIFNRNTQYETNYGEMVKMYSQRRSGTVIIYPAKKEEIGGLFDFNKDKKKFTLHGFAYCEESFKAPVEVYNVKGLNWGDLQELISEGGYVNDFGIKIPLNLFRTEF